MSIHSRTNSDAAITAAPIVGDPLEELAQLNAILKDPAAVHINMLRGGIARPSLRSLLHLYGAAALARWDAVDDLLAAAKVLVSGHGTLADIQRAEAAIARVPAESSADGDTGSEAEGEAPGSKTNPESQPQKEEG